MTLHRYIFLRFLITPLLLLAGAVNAYCQDSPDTSTPLAEIPFRLVGSHVMIELHVNDEKETSHFVFDSGASTTVIDKAFAKELKLKPDFEQSATGAGGSEVYQICLQQKLRFQNLEIEPVMFVLTDLSSLSSQMDQKIQGITGIDFFKRYVVEINHSTRIIKLFSKDTKPVTSGYEAVKFENFGPSPIPVVEASFELCNGETFEGKFLLDTGAGLTLLLNTPFNKENNVKQKSEKSFLREAGGLTRRTLYDTVKIKSVKFAGHEFGEMEIELSNSTEGVTSQANVTGLIGNDLLKRFDIIADYANKTFYFRPNELIDEKFKFNVNGLQFEKSGDQVIIQRVVKGCPAAESGLRAGDAIVSIDGKTSNKILELKDLLSEEAESVSVIISRDGKEMEFSFELKRLL